jgi:TPR repeat protein
MFAVRSILATLCAIVSASVHAQSKAASAAQACYREADAPREACWNPPDCKGLRTWLETCQRALAADPNDPSIKMALSRALSVARKRDEAVALMRSAAEQDDPAALLALYWEYQSFNRHLDRPQTVTRAEAEKALRRAAKFGHPDAVFRLAAALYRGGAGLKRDRASARVWGERVLVNPPKDIGVGDIQPVVGDWLAHSDDPEVRNRGIALLEALPGRGDAQSYLALAVRASDPLRARRLLESAVRTYPGHALGPLAEMLIAGEGGSKDERRALALLRHAPVDAQHPRALLGRLMLEGRLVPRDVDKAVQLLLPWSQWDYDTRLLILQVLAANPDIQLGRPDVVLYDATEAVELGEPGAMDALIALKLSRHAQFADTVGACALAERAAKLGNDAARRLETCRNK